MKNRKVVITLLSALFVYILLSVVNTLYWMDSFRDNDLIEAIGQVTDGDLWDMFWLPGQFFAFFMGVIVDADVPIIGGFFSYGVYALLILKVCGVSITKAFKRRNTETTQNK